MLTLSEFHKKFVAVGVDMGISQIIRGIFLIQVVFLAIALFLMFPGFRVIFPQSQLSDYEYDSGTKRVSKYPFQITRNTISYYFSVFSELSCISGIIVVVLTGIFEYPEYLSI